MENKICNGCGRTNLPNAKSCTNCGLNLPQMNNKTNDEDPLKTIAVGRQEMKSVIDSIKDESTQETPNFSSSSAKKESKGLGSKFYWILGGVGALAIIGGLFVIALGTGIYLYASSGSDEVVKNERNPKPSPIVKNENETDKPNEKTPSKLNAKGKTAFGEALIKRLKGETSTVGNFKVTLIDAKDSKTFVNAFETITAVYEDQNSKDMVVHSSSGYDNWQTAKKEATKRLREFKRRDRKLVKTIKKDSVSSAFIVNNRHFYLTCKRVETMGLCQMISSKEETAFKNYLNAYFK